MVMDKLTMKTGFDSAAFALLGIGTCLMPEAALARVPAAPKEPGTNVIIVMTDDQGYGELSCHGNPVLKTPEIDRLYARSIRFTGYHSAPMCTPTRGQLITGMDAARNGAVNVSSGRCLLRRDIPTMADIFSGAGYLTGIFGKWHLGDNYPYRPEDRGFSETLWFPSSHISSVPDYWGNDYIDDVYIHNGKREPVSGYCTDVFFARAMEFIQRAAGEKKPFLVYLPTNAPHSPLIAPTEDRIAMEKAFESSPFSGMDQRIKNRLINYLAMIRNIDTNMGRLVQFLEKEKLLNNTILIFATDNGTTHGLEYYNAGMRGMKTELYEGGHRVPLFISWPDGGFTRPRDVSGLTQAQDILPTLIDLCNVDYRSPLPFDGISLAPVLRGMGEIDEDRMLVINFSRMPIGFDYPSPDAPSIMRREGAAVLWKQWRLIEDRELFDLSADPLQGVNVIDQFPDVVREMRVHLDRWWNSVKDLANEPQRVVIGNEHENPVMLTACEWMDVFLDQQSQVRKGVRKNSYWELMVDQSGDYEFELRRWPRELDLPIAGKVQGGVALPVASARLMISGVRHVDIKRPFAFEGEEKKVGPNDTSVTFTVKLEEGPVILHTWFNDEAGNTLSGAYYVYVNRRQ